MPTQQARHFPPGKRAMAFILALIFVFLMVGLSSAHAVALSSPAHPILWLKECLTCGQNVSYGNLVGLAIDQQNDIHYVYNHMASSAYTITASYQDNAGWHTQAIDNQCGLTFGRLNIQVDVNGFEHILYDCDGSTIHYAYRDPNGWHTGEIFQAADFGYPYPAQDIRVNSLVLDSAGRPRASIVAMINRGLTLTYFVYLTERGWRMIQVGAGDFGAIALDALDQPLAVYSTRIWDEQGLLANITLTYAYLDQLGWHPHMIQSQNAGLEVAIAVDKSGMPGVLTNSGLYSTPVGNSWISEQVYAGQNPILLLDKLDRPYFSGTDGWKDIVFSFKQDQRLVYGTISGMTLGGKESMALDSADNLHLAYREDGTYNVIHLYPFMGPIHQLYLPAFYK